VRAFWLGLSVVLTASVSNATAVFMGLGTLPGSASSAAYAVSADGSTVVGYSDDEAFRWTASDGMVGWASSRTGWAVASPKACRPTARWSSA
jgi:uncharacterized membrane protein